MGVPTANKVFGDWEAHRLIPSPTTRRRPGKLSRSEMLFIVVLFHLSPFKHFKAFYPYGIGQRHRACFGDLPHYDRFVSLVPRLFAPLVVLLHSLGGEPTGVYFADQPSSPFATTAASTATGSSTAWPRGARPAWGGSMASSCTSWSTTRARSWR
jgi:hypothetical protein